MNTTFAITCSILKGSQPFFFEWYRNGQPLRPGPDVTYRIDSSEVLSSLTIKSVNVSDAGNYTCKVNNGGGSDSQNVQLTVKGKFFLSRL